jgi:hypothetical protein
MATFPFIYKDKIMKHTRRKDDKFVSIKVPAKLLRLLKQMAIDRNKFLYQVIAELIYNDISEKKTKIA